MVELQTWKSFISQWVPRCYLKKQWLRANIISILWQPQPANALQKMFEYYPISDKKKNFRENWIGPSFAELLDSFLKRQRCNSRKAYIFQHFDRKAFNCYSPVIQRIWLPVFWRKPCADSQLTRGSEASKLHNYHSMINLSNLIYTH